MLLFEVKEILIENPDILIEIVGHTDYEDNYRAGLGYARQVRWYLITKGGVDRNNIIATSKGESAPIDTNKSDRGRIANRRIEVIFK
jgi:OOP family OmpA-OmpF porin